MPTLITQKPSFQITDSVIEFLGVSAIFSDREWRHAGESIYGQKGSLTNRLYTDVDSELEKLRLIKKLSRVKTILLHPACAIELCAHGVIKKDMFGSKSAEDSDFEPIVFIPEQDFLFGDKKVTAELIIAACQNQFTFRFIDAHHNDL